MDEGAARAPEVWLRGAGKQQRREQEVMAGGAAASGGCAWAALRAKTAAVKGVPTRTTAGAAFAGA
eukprot:4825365-Pyramimonas_sp.AAC.1